MTDGRNFSEPEITQHSISAVVKWFNPTKGFGFVQPEDGSPDAFLHISVVERSGHATLPPGASIICDLSEGRRGPQVAAIHSITSMPETPVQSVGSNHGNQTVEGKVKFFSSERGFGFVTPDDGSKDIFVSGRTLERAGLVTLAPDQRVRLSVRMGHKGPMADSLEII